MGFGAFLTRRVINLIALLIGIALLNYFLFRVMPGDVVSLILDPKATAAEKEAVRQAIGLGAKNPVQAVANYMVSLFTGNFGNSFVSHQPVWTEIIRRLPSTLLLLGTANMLSLLVGIVTGVFAASRRGRPSDTTVVTSSIAIGSLPTFWIGLVFLLFFSVYLARIGSPFALPSTGTIGPYWSATTLAANFGGFVRDSLQHLILPLATLTLFLYGGTTLLVRNTFLDVLTEDYILTAKAKGLTNSTVLYRHALRNAALPVTTATALSFGTILGGAALTETVFNWYGLGAYIVSSVQGRDWPVLQGVFFLLAITTIAANFISDLVYAYLDPRVRLQ